MHADEFEDPMQKRVAMAVKNTGIQKRLKSELRFRLIESLNRESNPTRVDAARPPLEERALFSLILEVLKKHSKHFSVSVLLPECGMATSDVLTRTEVAKVFSLRGLSLVEEDDQSLLENCLASCARESTQSTSGTQTDPEEARSLNAKLQACMSKDPTKDYRTIEERMLEFQARCEARCRQEAEAEIQRVRKIERERIILEESAKCRNEMQDVVLKTERDLREREQRHRSREQAALERLRAKELELERKAMDWRAEAQRALEEGASRQRVRLRQVEVDEQRVVMQTKALDTRELDLKARCERLDSERSMFKAEAETKFQSSKTELEAALAKDREEIRMLGLALEKRMVRAEREENQWERMEQRLAFSEKRLFETQVECQSSDDRCAARDQELWDTRRLLCTLQDSMRVHQTTSDSLRAEITSMQRELEASHAERTVGQEAHQARQQEAEKAQAVLDGQVVLLQHDNSRLLEELEHMKCRLKSYDSEKCDEETRQCRRLMHTWHAERLSYQAELERLRKDSAGLVSCERELQEKLRSCQEECRALRCQAENFRWKAVDEAEEARRAKTHLGVVQLARKQLEENVKEQAVLRHARAIQQLEHELPHESEPVPQCQQVHSRVTPPTQHFDLSPRAKFQGNVPGRQIELRGLAAPTENPPMSGALKSQTLAAGPLPTSIASCTGDTVTLQTPVVASKAGPLPQSRHVVPEVALEAKTIVDTARSAPAPAAGSGGGQDANWLDATRRLEEQLCGHPPFEELCGPSPPPIQATLSFVEEARRLEREIDAFAGHGDAHREVASPCSDLETEKEVACQRARRVGRSPWTESPSQLRDELCRSALPWQCRSTADHGVSAMPSVSGERPGDYSYKGTLWSSQDIIELRRACGTVSPRESTREWERADLDTLSAVRADPIVRADTSWDVPIRTHWEMSRFPNRASEVSPHWCDARDEGTSGMRTSAFEYTYVASEQETVTRPASKQTPPKGMLLRKEATPASEVQPPFDLKSKEGTEQAEPPGSGTAAASCELRKVTDMFREDSCEVPAMLPVTPQQSRSMADMFRDASGNDATPHSTPKREQPSVLVKREEQKVCSVDQVASHPARLVTDMFRDSSEEGTPHHSVEREGQQPSSTERVASHPARPVTDMFRESSEEGTPRHLVECEGQQPGSTEHVASHPARPVSDMCRDSSEEEPLPDPAVSAVVVRQTRTMTEMFKDDSSEEAMPREAAQEERPVSPVTRAATEFHEGCDEADMSRSEDAKVRLASKEQRHSDSKSDAIACQAFLPPQFHSREHCAAHPAQVPLRSPSGVARGGSDFSSSDRAGDLSPKSGRGSPGQCQSHLSSSATSSSRSFMNGHSACGGGSSRSQKSSRAFLAGVQRDSRPASTSSSDSARSKHRDSEVVSPAHSVSDFSEHCRNTSGVPRSSVVVAASDSVQEVSGPSNGGVTHSGRNDNVVAEEGTPEAHAWGRNENEEDLLEERVTSDSNFLDDSEISCQMGAESDDAWG